MSHMRSPRWVDSTIVIALGGVTALWDVAALWEVAALGDVTAPEGSALGSVPGRDECELMIRDHNGTTRATPGLTTSALRGLGARTLRCSRFCDRSTPGRSPFESTDGFGAEARSSSETR